MLLPHLASSKGLYQAAHLRLQPMMAGLECLLVMFSRFGAFLPCGLVLGWTDA